MKCGHITQHPLQVFSQAGYRLGILLTLIGISTPQVFSQVSAADDHIVINFSGMVDYTTRQSHVVEAHLGNQFVDWKSPQGRQVKPGDPLIGFNSEKLLATIHEREYDLIVAADQLALRELELTERHSELLRSQKDLIIEINKAREVTSAVGFDKQFDSAQAELDYQQAVREQNSAQITLNQQTIAYQQGRTSREKLTDAQHQFEQSSDHVKTKRSILNSVLTRTLAYVRQLRAFDEERLSNKLGRRDAEQSTGIIQELHFKLISQELEIANRQEELDRRRIALDEIISQVSDVFPLQSLKLSSSDWSQTINDSSTILNHLHTNTTQWAQAYDPATTPIIGAATLSLDAPPGEVTVTVTVGGKRAWAGAALRVHDQRLILDKVPPGQQTHHLVVQHPGGPLHLQFGGPSQRTLRADRTGIAFHRDNIDLGESISRNEKLLYIIPPHSLRLKARLHQDLVSLITTSGSTTLSEDPDDVTALMQHGLATSHILIDTEHGVLDGSVSSISDRAITVAWSKEKARSWHQQQRTPVTLGREILIEAAQPELLVPAIGKRVQLRAILKPPQSYTILPAHMAETVGNRIRIWTNSQTDSPTFVDGIRIGDYFVINTKLSLAQMKVPPADGQWSQHTGLWLQGQVIPGSTTSIVVQDIRGEVASALPDGSIVEKGAPILSLESRRLQGLRDDMEQALAASRRTAIEATEQRQERANDRRERQRDMQIDAESAQISLLEMSNVPQDTIIEATALQQQRSLQLSYAQSQLEQAKQAQAIMSLKQLKQLESNMHRSALQLESAELASVHRQRTGSLVTLLEAHQTLTDRLQRLQWNERQLRIDAANAIVSQLSSELENLENTQLIAKKQKFDQNKQFIAPVSGHLTYRPAWNSRARRYTTLEVGSTVWSGMTIADILDLHSLAFQVDVSESMYRALTVNDPVQLRFSQFSAEPLRGVISDMGQEFFIPEDNVLEGDGTITSQRYLTVTISFSVPDTLQGRLMPGAKGEVMFQ